MKFSLVTAAASVVSIVHALAAPAVTQPDPSKVYITGIKYGGSGCKQDSATVFLSDDKESFTVIFDEYIAAAGPKYPQGLKPNYYKDRKNCQLNINMHVPSGWQYSVFSADYRGFLDLDNDVVATQAAHYYFTGVQGTAITQSQIVGKVEKNYEIVDKIPFSSVVWCECGADAAININSEVRIDTTQAKKGSSGIITTDSLDGKVQFKVGFQWRKCK